ncbi:MAG TPA: non-homologous end-joining DNA ligase [Actinomycetota bacterium]|nr:non-homologous end-joining DNA ligase [Actinomycetota bacterium]
MSELPTTLPFPLAIPAEPAGDTWVTRSGATTIRLTNSDKIFWPETGYTKGDLLTYYFNVALAILPHLTDRPLTLKRQPEGIAGPYFYEKDAPSYTPQWMPTLDVPAEKGARTIRALTIRDVASLLVVVNLGCIELHPWLARGPEQEHPTHAVFDLDPFRPAGWDDVRHVADLIRVALERLDLASVPKTSGRSGMQVFVPLDGSQPFEVVRRFVNEVCTLVHRAEPSATTFEWQIARRAGKVFLDANMNRRAASFAAPYSVRADWDAPVAMPFTWAEIDEIDPHAFTIATAIPRINERDDPFAAAAERGADLTPALRALGL